MSVPTVVKVGRTATGYRLRVEGRGTMWESPAVQQFAMRALEDQAALLAVDLSACDYLDSTFLGCLVVLHKRFGSAMPERLWIVAPPETCHRLLNPAHLDALLKTSDSSPDVTGEELTIPTVSIGMRELGEHIMECHRRLAEVVGRERDAFAEVADGLAAELVKTD
jgi:anti-anti-sigma regulatory factor